MTTITMARLIDDGRLRLADQMPDGTTIQERLNAFALGILNELATAAGQDPVAMPDFGEGEGDVFAIQGTDGSNRIALNPSKPEAALLIDLSDFESFETSEPDPEPEPDPV